MRRFALLFFFLLASPALGQETEIKLPFCAHSYEQVVKHLGSGWELAYSTSIPNSSSGRYEWFRLSDEFIIVSVLTLDSNRILGLPADWVCALNRGGKPKSFT